MAASRLHLIMPAAGGVQRGFWLDELDVALLRRPPWSVKCRDYSRFCRFVASKWTIKWSRILKEYLDENVVVTPKWWAHWYPRLQEHVAEYGTQGQQQSKFVVLFGSLILTMLRTKSTTMRTINIFFIRLFWVGKQSLSKLLDFWIGWTFSFQTNDQWLSTFRWSLFKRKFIFIMLWHALLTL